MIDTTPEIQDWITSVGGDVQLVIDICFYHMQMKSFKRGVQGIDGGMGINKRTKFIEARGEQLMAYLEVFSTADNMLIPFNLGYAERILKTIMGTS